ncbi:MAG: purine-nucleoside phosphorylase [Clostridia bacterium]|nr:purine-nucleoside phosphorylase [Clostridia bacterium]
MQDLLEKALEAGNYIRTHIPDVPDTVVILGSGLGKLADEIRDAIEIPYADIPNFKTSTVKGHDNKLIYGTIYGKKILAMKGRYHFYEGYSMQEAAFPIRVFALLGIRNLIVSNAAGGINKKFKVGDLMLITDHIKLCAESPLRGENEEVFGTRFPNMTDAYPVEFRNLAKSVASNLKMELQEGVYAFMAGPQYETTAEIKMLATIGADAVGMSTVPEVIAAVHSGMNVLGISCITDMTGSGQQVSHEEVMKAAGEAEGRFVRLVMEIINQL